MLIQKKGTSGLDVLFFVAKDRQAPDVLAQEGIYDRKNMEHKVRNVCMCNRVGASLLD